MAVYSRILFTIFITTRRSGRYSRTGMEQCQLSAREVRASGVAVYKVTGGAKTVREYNDEMVNGDLDGRAQPPALSDWMALYTQFQCDHVLGTVPYRWEKEDSEATLVEVRFTNPVDVIVLDGPILSLIHI